MTTPPSLTLPRWGERLHPALAYVKRISAARQAAAWNQQLVGDPVLGPSSGFYVGVGAAQEQVDLPGQVRKRYPLIWLPIDIS